MTLQEYTRHSLSHSQPKSNSNTFDMDGPSSSALFSRSHSHSQPQSNQPLPSPHRHSLGAPRLNPHDNEKPAVLTRHESFQYTPSSQPRAPPPLRTAQSFSTPKSTPMVRKSSDKEDGEELTTKGRKRKRLAKACSACHVSAVYCGPMAERSHRVWL